MIRPLVVLLFLAAVPSKFETAGYTVEFSSTNLRAFRTANPLAPVFDLRKLATQDWKDINAGVDSREFSSQRTARLLSVAAGVLSFEETDGCDCGGAHPSLSRHFRTVDLAHGKPAHLENLFPPDEIYKALLQDSVVTKALNQNPPATLAALTKALEFKQTTVGECDFYFAPELLQEFAFYNVENGYVSVRLSLSHAAEICRGEMTQIGIRLPIPEKLKPEFAAAKAKANGLLMVDASKASVLFQFGQH